MSDNRKILVVCDDWARLEWYEDQLTPRFKEVLGEFLWKEALLCAAREKPDLALIDLVMEDCHTLELARKFKADAALSLLPLILMLEPEEQPHLLPGENERWKIVFRPFDAEAVFADL